MLAIFNKEMVQPPQELNSPSMDSSKKPKLPQHILQDFLSDHPNDAFSITYGSKALLAYTPPRMTCFKGQRMFCGLDGLNCIFIGSLINLSSLIKQYGLSKGANEAMFVIEAYRTLRDRGPYPADQVLKDLDGSFGFVGCNEEVSLYWGIAADGSVVICDSLELIKSSCAKSFAPFPNGCMFHSEHGLMSFEHPKRKMKAMPRIDSEGVMCGANFKVDVQSMIHTMPRVGSEANWATWGFNA
ncbi:hypothetical protein FEM48_Zijuj01G0151000 [Ziziphus jujuba var. spinosa]|uniref:DUF3700 domain-containing protein n=1 Tax=Ziziphus jujuba var. spinosa TaxID=714518 RepID=A0A978W1Z0_ZIZJJ|nr:hypothetical protein FEM48_Zijuj01G0151000 [Ziziphus jujuba var. spinosa]